MNQLVPPFFFFKYRKVIETKRKDLEEKEKQLAEIDRQLQKRKEQMDQLEKSLQKVLLRRLDFEFWMIIDDICLYFQAGGAAAAAGEVNKKLTETQRQLETYEHYFLFTRLEFLLQTIF